MDSSSFHFQRRISCKLKSPWGVPFLAIIFYLSIIATAVDGTGKKDGHIYNGHMPAAVTQRISIILGGSGDDSPHIANVGDNVGGIFADDDDGGGDGGGGGGSGRSISETTSWDMCRGSRSTCCFQYTWPGFVSNIPDDPHNATCAYLRDDRGDASFPCFDPIVYTTPVEGSDEPIGNPPDIDRLQKGSQANKWNIYCPMTDKSCVIITYYARSGNDRMANQTKFCGVVTSTNTGEQLQNGCYSQKVDGYTRQVCVCNGHLCNQSSRMTGLPTFALILIALFSVALQFHYNNNNHIIYLNANI